MKDTHGYISIYKKFLKKLSKTVDKIIRILYYYNNKNKTIVAPVKLHYIKDSMEF